MNSTKTGTGHVHARKMAEYAQGSLTHEEAWRLWQWRSSSIAWRGLVEHPAWKPEHEYRRKPRTIKINGHKVPEPVREPLGDGQRYWVPAIGFTFAGLGYTSFWWNGLGGDEADQEFLSLGLIHLSEESALQHRAALLSFTDGSRPDTGGRT